MVLKCGCVSILVLSLLLTAPLGGAQTTAYGATSGDPRHRDDTAACWEQVEEGSGTPCVALYAHIYDILHLPMLTTQRPPDWIEDLSDGYGGSPGIEPLWDMNQIVMRPSPGPVEYSPDGDPAVHPAHGLARDLHLDPHLPLHAYWTMSADMAEYTPLGLDPVPGDPSIGTFPCFTVRVTLETGRHPGQGRLLTEGQVTKSVVTGTTQDDPDAAHDCPGDRAATMEIDEVIEFHIEMPPVQIPVPASEGLVMKVEWWNFAPDDPDHQDKVYGHSWNVHTGPEFVPRLVLPVRDPLWTDALEVTFDEGHMTIQTAFQSDFGANDIDPGSIRFQVYDAGGGEVPIHHGGMVLRSSDHQSFYQPLRPMIRWDHQKEDLPPGPYTLRMSASNWQWSNETANETTIVLHAEAAESPSIGPLLTLLPFLLLWASRPLCIRRTGHRNP